VEDWKQHSKVITEVDVTSLPGVTTKVTSDGCTSGTWIETPNPSQLLLQAAITNEQHCSAQWKLFLGSITGVWTQDFTLARHALHHLRHYFSPFFVGYFLDRVSWTIYLDWSRISILLISISWVAMVTGMRHWCLTQDEDFVFNCGLNSEPDTS
jgi:hypothetical protein